MSHSKAKRISWSTRNRESYMDLTCCYVLPMTTMHRIDKPRDLARVIKVKCMRENIPKSAWKDYKSKFIHA